MYTKTYFLLGGVDFLRVSIVMLLTKDCIYSGRINAILRKHGSQAGLLSQHILSKYNSNFFCQ